MSKQVFLKQLFLTKQMFPTKTTGMTYSRCFLYMSKQMFLTKQMFYLYIQTAVSQTAVSYQNSWYDS